MDAGAMFGAKGKVEEKKDGLSGEMIIILSVK